MNPTLRVLIADDHQPIRVAVREALEMGGCEVVAEADSAYSAVEMAAREHPDVCLLDIAMPGSGLWAVRAITQDNPTCKCVMLTVSEDSEHLFDALQAGAVGYLLKDVSPSTLAPAVYAAFHGEAVLSGALTARVVDALRGKARPDGVVNSQGHVVSFTERESAVLQLLVGGLTTGEIAKRLFVQPITVRRHIADAVRKLRVTDRAEAIALLSDQWGSHSAGRRAPLKH